MSENMGGGEGSGERRDFDRGAARSVLQRALELVALRTPLQQDDHMPAVASPRDVLTEAAAQLGNPHYVHDALILAQRYRGAITPEEVAASPAIASFDEFIDRALPINLLENVLRTILAYRFPDERK